MTITEEKIREKIEEFNWINASFIIEVQGNDKKTVKNSLEKMLERMENEKGIEIYDKKYDEMQELKEKWHSLNVEVKFIAKDFGRLTHMALLYSPSVVEIFEPKQIKMDVGDAQNILVDIASVVTSLAHAIFAQQGKIVRAQKEAQKKTKPKSKSKS